MAQVQVDIFQGQVADAEVDYRDSLPVNMYHIPKMIGKAKGYLRSQWGLELFADVLGRDGGGFWSSVFKNHFRVSNGDLITVSKNGDVTNLGSIGYFGQCTFNQTERNVAITTNSGCWLYNTLDGLRQIDDPDLGAVFDTVYLNQRLVHTDGEFIIVSNPGNDEEYDTLKYGTAEIDPDGIVGLASISNRLLAVGSDTIEWFADQPTSGDTFPYVRIEAQLIEVGASGTHAKVQMIDSNGFKSVYFIGGGKNDPVAFRQTGAGNAPKLSTKEIDQILQSYTNEELSTAILENRTIEANNFIFIHLPSHTLSFDIAASGEMGMLAWTIQKTDVSGDTPSIWINGVYDPRNSSFIYGDKRFERLGKLTKSLSTQYGETVESIFYTPILPFKRKTVSELSLETLPGRNEPDTEPVIFISSSTNGLIYSQEYLISMGTQGDYNHNLVVRMNDYFSRPTSYKFRVANNQPVNVSDLTLEVI